VLNLGSFLSLPFVVSDDFPFVSISRFFSNNSRLSRYVVVTTRK